MDDGAPFHFSTMPQPQRRTDKEYELTVRQEPKQARMCGVGGKADRRPIDPPPIVQLRVIDHSSPGSNSSNGAAPPNPYYFMFASLASPDSDEELHLLKDGKTRCTTGSVVSSLYHLKDSENNGQDAGFFVFPDLSVRTEGSYRLKLTLFEVVGPNVHHCKSIFSKPFYVYTAKKFPGMEESTQLSCSLADQGIKIRIRKDIRVRKRPIQGPEDDDDDDDDEQPSGSAKRPRGNVPAKAPGVKGAKAGPRAGPNNARDSKRQRMSSEADSGGQSTEPWPMMHPPDHPVPPPIDDRSQLAIHPDLRGPGPNTTHYPPSAPQQQWGPPPDHYRGMQPMPYGAPGSHERQPAPYGTPGYPPEYAQGAPQHYPAQPPQPHYGQPSSPRQHPYAARPDAPYPYPPAAPEYSARDAYARDARAPAGQPGREAYPYPGYAPPHAYGYNDQRGGAPQPYPPGYPRPPSQHGAPPGQWVPPHPGASAPGQAPYPPYAPDQQRGPHTSDSRGRGGPEDSRYRDGPELEGRPHTPSRVAYAGAPTGSPGDERRTNAATSADRIQLAPLRTGGPTPPGTAIPPGAAIGYPPQPYDPARGAAPHGHYPAPYSVRQDSQSPTTAYHPHPHAPSVHQSARFPPPSPQTAAPDGAYYASSRSAYPDHEGSNSRAEERPPNGIDRSNGSNTGGPVDTKKNPLSIARGRGRDAGND